MEKEAWKVDLVVQGMLMDFECRFLERKTWRIIFEVSFRDGIPSLSSSYNISGLVPVCWLLFQSF